MLHTEDDLIPVHVISGFLGAGKTTLLRHILHNKEGLHVGVVVNDVAASNIDAKLTRTTAMASNETTDAIFDPSNSVELDNGCVCCSLSDELLVMIQKLVDLGIQRGRKFDRIIIECTGVAEPKAVVDTFEEAKENEMPLFKEIRFANVITVVDSATFVRDFQSKHLVEDRPDIADGEGAGEGRHVVDLLVEQVEAADIIILNKADRLKPEQMARLEATIGQLNTKAETLQAQYSQVGLSTLFAAKGTNTEDVGHGEGHAEGHGDGHGHGGHGDGHGEHGDGHGGHGGHGDGHGEHGDGHGGHGGHGDGHGEHGDGHGGHGGHGDGHGEHGDGHGGHGGHGDGKDGGHGDGHGHGHAHAHDRSQDNGAKFNISNFTYARRRPFDPTRLQVFLQGLPADVGRCVVPVGEGKKEEVDALKKLLRPIIRSKGFCWLTSQPKTALYWAHAGNFFEMQTEGAWWADAPEDCLPADSSTKSKILADFEEPFGDRRQEIVFIGIGMNRESIEAELDKCLLSEEELQAYMQSTNQGSGEGKKQRIS